MAAAFVPGVTTTMLSVAFVGTVIFKLKPQHKIIEAYVRFDNENRVQACKLSVG